MVRTLMSLRSRLTSVSTLPIRFSWTMIPARLACRYPFRNALLVSPSWSASSLSSISPSRSAMPSRAVSKASSRSPTMFSSLALKNSIVFAPNYNCYSLTTARPSTGRAFFMPVLLPPSPWVARR
ncbi:MAG: hypothetical protein CMP81_00025 [Fulvimarina sp.]|nr:hypothetical protein [Fulvimarina sp.]